MELFPVDTELLFDDDSVDVLDIVRYDIVPGIVTVVAYIFYIYNWIIIIPSVLVFVKLLL